MKLTAFVLGTAITILGLLYVSYILTGDWKFIQKSYIDYYFPKDHKPTIGFLWALFSGVIFKSICLVV